MIHNKSKVTFEERISTEISRFDKPRWSHSIRNSELYRVTKEHVRSRILNSDPF